MFSGKVPVKKQSAVQTVEAFLDLRELLPRSRYRDNLVFKRDIFEVQSEMRKPSWWKQNTLLGKADERGAESYERLKMYEDETRGWSCQNLAYPANLAFGGMWTGKENKNRKRCRLLLER